MKFIKNAWLDLKENQAKISRESLRFHKGRHWHHNVIYDTMHYPEGSIILLSIKLIYYLEVVLPLSSLEMIWYSCIMEIHALRVNIHASRKIMHCGRSCIASQYSCIAEDHASRVNIHAPREDIYASPRAVLHEKISCVAVNFASREGFIPCRKLCVMRRFHTSQKIMHHEKISYLTEIMCREKISYLAENYASWEDFIPHRNYASR